MLLQSNCLRAENAMASGHSPTQRDLDWVKKLYVLSCQHRDKEMVGTSLWELFDKQAAKLKTEMELIEATMQMFSEEEKNELRSKNRKGQPKSRRRKTHHVCC